MYVYAYIFITHAHINISYTVYEYYYEYLITHIAMYILATYLYLLLNVPLTWHPAGLKKSISYPFVNFHRHKPLRTGAAIIALCMCIELFKRSSGLDYR